MIIIKIILKNLLIASITWAKQNFRATNKRRRNPKIPYPTDSNWDGLDLPWMAYGYGVAITPLQTLAFYNAIANDGEMVKQDL